MKEASDSRDALDKASKKLQDQYSANELKINQLNGQLRDKAMNLGLTELFGLARQVSNDVSTILQQSLITTQFPPAQGQQARDEFLRAFSASRTTPTAADLQRVWTEVQREMTASGQVAKYQATVVQPGGEPQKTEVIRVGPFTAISGGKFLSYLPTLRTFEILPRQLPSSFMSIANRFSSATSGYAEAVVDSARGVLTGLYVERPTFGERIKLGQEVGYVIITVGLLGALAFILQLIHLVLVRLAVSNQLKNLDRPSASNPLGRVLLAFKGDKTRIEDDADVAELRITEAVLKEVPKLERFQSFLRLAVAAGPLLGLIGTVVGHDPHVPEHQRVGLERSEAHGHRHRTGDDRHGARPRYRDPAAVRRRAVEHAVASRCPNPRRTERGHARGEHREATPCLISCRSSGASRRS